MAIFKGAGVAIVTPMNEDGSVNYEKFGELIEFQIANGTDAIIVCGTTGESSTLTHEEHLDTIKYCVDKVAKRIPVVAGTGSNCTETAVYLSQEAEKYGVDGILLVSLADTDVAWIMTYEADGTNSYTGQAHMTDGGYPVSVSLSPDGELLAISYLYVDAGVVKSNVTFYNFGPVGENQSDYMVSAYSYSDLVVPKVQFMNNDTAFAVGDSRLMIYSGTQKPVTAGEYLYDDEIQSIFYSDKYVGLVFLSDQAETKYRMDVYNTSAAKVGSYYFDVDYTDIFFGDDDMVIYNESECQIFTTDGVEKYHGSFGKSARLLLPAGGSYKYYLVTDSTIDTIQLK